MVRFFTAAAVLALAVALSASPTQASSYSRPPPVAKVLNSDFSKDSDGWSYMDDTFRGTQQPDYADGEYDKSEKAVVVVLGGVDNDDLWDMSGKL